jgi:hypothetical protein
LGCSEVERTASTYVSKWFGIFMDLII